MAAAKITLIIECKADYKRGLGFYLDKARLLPADFTGCTANAAIKINHTDEVPLLAFHCAIPNPESGIIEISLTAVETTTLNKVPKACWDLLVTYADGTRKRLADGPVQLSPGVTD